MTKEEERELRRLQRFLRIADEQIAHSRETLHRLRLVSDLRRGVLPILSDANIVLQKGEQAHWRVAASLWEERVVGKRYQGGSHGVSIRVAKGLSFRVGAHRGQIITDKAVVAVSRGDFVVTDKRLVFSGDRKSFSVKYEKLLDADMYSDGIRVTPSSGKPHTLRLRFCTVYGADIIRVVLNQALKKCLDMIGAGQALQLPRKIPEPPPLLPHDGQGLSPAPPWFPSPLSWSFWRSRR